MFKCENIRKFGDVLTIKAVTAASKATRSTPRSGARTTVIVQALKKIIVQALKKVIVELAIKPTQYFFVGITSLITIWRMVISDH